VAAVQSDCARDAENFEFFVSTGSNLLLSLGPRRIKAGQHSFLIHTLNKNGICLGNSAIQGSPHAMASLKTLG
jgi:hypothetical protein